MAFTVKHAVGWLETTNTKLQTNKAYLTSLDQAIGDGDHGINMARGFNKVVEKITAEDYQDVGAVMKDIAMTIISKVGGAAGPLYGTAFLKMSQVLEGVESVDYETFTKGLEAGLHGIKQRGKAHTAEKTLIDVWYPVVEQLKRDRNFVAEHIISTAKEAMEKTKDTMATKGRAAYLKERSIGHIDPGSMSSFYLFQALAEVTEGGI